MNTHRETISRAGGREYNSGKKSMAIRKAMNATASQRVQRGTNRPLGKSKKNSTTHATPTICTPRTGNHQAGWEETKASAAVESTVTVPKDTRNSEVSSAIRSSEPRQKTSASTANTTSSQTSPLATSRTA